MTSKYIQIHEIRVFKALESWHLKTYPWETGNKQSQHSGCSRWLPSGNFLGKRNPGRSLFSLSFGEYFGHISMITFPLPCQSHQHGLSSWKPGGVPVPRSKTHKSVGPLLQVRNTRLQFKKISNSHVDLHSISSN